MPGAHLAQLAAPGDGAAEPAGQKVQNVAPEPLVNLPAGQGAHALPRKLAFAKKPGAQNSHALSATDAALPGGHNVALATHSVRLGALSQLGAQAAQAAEEAAAAVVQKDPGGQGVQVDADVAPSTALYLPGAQGVSVVAPGGAQKPAGLHTPAPALEPVPRAQGRHAEEEAAEGEARKRPAAQGRQAAAL